MPHKLPATGCAPIVPLIVRGDLAHYRFLARTADEATLRVLVIVMAADLEEALEAACPMEPKAIDDEVQSS